MPRYRPTFDEFAALATGHTVVPVYRQLVADALTPVSAFRRLDAGGRAFLFESVVGGERVGRYSFLGADPFLTVEATGPAVTVSGPGGHRTETRADDPVRVFEELLAAYRAPHLPGLPRFCGGAVGYAGYDTVRYVERLPNAPPDDRNAPDLSFSFYDRMVIFDHITKVVNVVAQAHVGQERGVRGEGLGVSEESEAAGDNSPGSGISLTPYPLPLTPLQEAYDAACRRVDEVVARLQTAGGELPPTDIDPTAGVPREAGREGELPARFRSNMTRDQFEAGVRKAKDYILAGDAFQVVLSQRFRAETTADPFTIYRALRVVNPSPFMFLLRAGPVRLVGASPEIMCRVENGEMVVRPLAGTRRRGATDDEDRRLADDLLADPKERAEHIMLVDLGRNDIGRVCELGSVAIRDLLQVEKYSHVMHLSSTVVGQLAAGKTAFDALRSALPAGTLSGAPKVRAMEIIDEIEPTRRGPYGGAVGYVDFSGNMDTCIALRTMVVIGGTADVQAGAGVVADSDPAAEYQETVNKAMGLLRALEVAEGQLTE